MVKADRLTAHQVMRRRAQDRFFDRGRGMDGVAAVAAKLPEMHGAALELMRGRRSSPVAVYLLLLSDAKTLDLTSEAALAFRTRFNGYYGVRRNASWRETFYRSFESMKSGPCDHVALFEDCLRDIWRATGRVEASFASKAVATIHPPSPVIDKILRDRLDELAVPPPFGGGLDEAIEYFRWLNDFITHLARTPEAAEWFANFDRAFGGVPGASEIHHHKKLDFLIWAARGLD